MTIARLYPRLISTHPDGALSPDEAAQLRDHFFQELTPVASDLSTSFRGIKSIVLCKNGIHGQRVKRFCNEAWARRGESNVIDLFPRVPQDAA